ncbi:keratin, type II cytoskeletal 68 kDa, component IB-like [Chenopodium quinoa]|uniref:keratin, type II cytoskeletal 68 kDa, component IB-like n=1 Tax=Chenopodium quinoa TaxID=63459 RepID=UPI000B789B74|nr:keratin, type II cytoskeletal 68 kDa, component IB-like [Chenopodium quinoa]
MSFKWCKVFKPEEDQSRGSCYDKDGSGDSNLHDELKQLKQHQNVLNSVMKLGVVMCVIVVIVYGQAFVGSALEDDIIVEGGTVWGGGVAWVVEGCGVGGGDVSWFGEGCGVGGGDVVVFGEGCGVCGGAVAGIGEGFGF